MNIKQTIVCNRDSLNQTVLTQLIFVRESLTYRVYEDKTMAGLASVTMDIRRDTTIMCTFNHRVI